MLASKLDSVPHRRMMMSFPRLPSLVRVAALAVLVTGLPASADFRDDYASAWLGERLRLDRPDPYWANGVANSAWRGWTPPAGPRTWHPRDENPWANTYGTPAPGAWTPLPRRPRQGGIVRLCACYLPDDARSWDGGPLTAADVARLCRAQCY